MVKIGGRVLEDAPCRDEMARQFRTLHARGHALVVVHGGGDLIDRYLDLHRIKSRFVRGLRVTDSAAMEVVEAALAGTANKQLVRAINRTDSASNEAPAVGISGQDGNLLQARPLDATESGGTDYGQVGQVEKVQLEVLEVLLERRLIPVVAPIGVGADGLGYNINADAAAAALAVALKAQHLVLASDTGGVLDGNGERIPRLSAELARQLIADGVIRNGMIPKVERALKAGAGGVNEVHILDGTKPDCLLQALLRGGESGTVVSRS